MQKNLLLVIGLVAAAGIAAFLWLKKPALNGTMSGSETVSANFAQLMALGKNYTCTFDSTDEDAGSRTSGTVYVAESGDKLNGVFTMHSETETEKQMYVIRDGEYNYMWSSDMEQGYKVKINPEDDQLFAGQTDDSDESTSFDENQQVDFHCRPWSVDNSMFVPPSTVQFMDMSAHMQMMMDQSSTQTAPQTTTAPEAGSANCGMCDQVPAGAARSQCLTALGC